MSDYRGDHICRTCLTETDDLRYLYREGKICGEITTLSEMLGECTSLEIHDDDHLPQYICSKCMLSLSKAYFFRHNCISADAQLRERHKESQLEDEEVAGSVYFYDIQESDNIAEEGSEQEQSYEYELKDTKFADESNSAAEEKDGEVEYEALMVTTEYNSPQEDEYHAQAVDAFTVEIEESVDEKTILPNQKSKKRKIRAPGPPFKCEYCPKLLSNYSSFKYHMQLHSDKTPFLCSECGEGFKTRNAYDGHMTTHDPTNPNRCTVCGKVYRQAASLRAHMLIHTGEKPFKCNICGKGMTQKSGFKKHMLTHTGEKPYKCDICGFSFRFSSNMITHRRRHTGEKPYVCSTCNKAFVSSEQLKRHQTVHTGEKMYKCEICGKTYSRKSTLQVHYVDQHQAERNTCRICGKEFENVKTLILHMNRHKDEGYEMEETIEINEHSEEEQDHEKLDDADELPES